MSELDLILKDVENYYKKSEEKHYNIVKDLRNQPLFTFDTLLKFTAMYKYERANEASTNHNKALDIDIVSVLSDLKEWCFDNCNASNSDRLHEILDRLDKR